MDAQELTKRKQRLSPKLLAVAGVSGVGLQQDAVAIYLESDADEVRRNVRAVVDAECPGTPIAFQVTGVFRKS